MKSQQHAFRVSPLQTFGALNISSVNDKLNVVKQLEIDHKIDVLCLTATRHEDHDAYCIRRLRSEGC